MTPMLATLTAIGLTLCAFAWEILSRKHHWEKAAENSQDMALPILIFMFTTSMRPTILTAILAIICLSCGFFLWTVFYEQDWDYAIRRSLLATFGITAVTVVALMV